MFLPTYGNVVAHKCFTVCTLFHWRWFMAACTAATYGERAVTGYFSSTQREIGCRQNNRRGS